MSCDFIALAAAGIRELQPYQPGKPVEELQRELGLSDIIKLASNENPLGASPKVAEALSEVIPDLARYPDGSAYELKHQLARFHGVAPETITIGNGSNDVLELLGRIFLNAENESIVSQHSFVVYPLVTRAVGASLRVIPAKEFGQDLEATAAAINERTRMVFIANPNNPTGTWINEAALVQFLDQVPEDVIVVLDEAYFEYVQHSSYPSGVKLLARYRNLVVTRTFSKAYGIASLRVGYSISNPDIADLMNRVRQPFNVNSVALIGALAALDDQDFVRRSVAMNAEGLQTLEQGCDQMGFSYIPSAGNFITVDLGRTALPVYEDLLHQGVIVRPIGVYEMPNHLRVTVGLPEENRRFLEALKQVS